MKFGIWTPLPHTIREEPLMTKAIAESQQRGGTQQSDTAFEFALSTALKAESYGFGITLIAERFLGPDLESWMLAATLAAKTSRIEIMPAVHPGMIPPQVVAKMGATLDRLSGGRFAVNLVNGWWKEEFDLFGNRAWLDDPEDRYKRMDEFIQVIRGLWIEDEFSFDGAFYHADNGRLETKPKRQPAPPIYAASRSESGKDVIARYCDVWFTSCGPDPEQYAANVETMARDIDDMRKRAMGFGREVKIGASAHVVCADTMEQAKIAANALLAYGKRDRISFIATNGLGVGLVGTPDFLAERIHQLSAIGVDLLMLKFSPMLEELDRFGTQVMPLLGSRSAPASVLRPQA